MKKIIIFAAAFTLAAGLFFGQASQSTTFNLSLYLNEYIETMPGPISWDLGHTTHDIVNGESGWSGLSQTWDFAYANCPFRVTLAGDNPAGEGKPRFARLETGTHTNGYDTIPTVYIIDLATNGVADPQVYIAGNFPISKEYAEAPHNGQIKLNIQVRANTAIASDTIPLRQTSINPAFTWDQSADAGVYTCSMVVTLGAL